MMRIGSILATVTVGRPHGLLGQARQGHSSAQVPAYSAWVETGNGRPARVSHRAARQRSRRRWRPARPIRTAMPLGGGTDLVVNIRRGIVAPPVLIDMNGVRSCARSAPTANGLEIGASARLSEMAEHPASSSTIPWSRRPLRHRRSHASQHGHGRRQPLPRHALHLLQSERMVARGQQPLPQDHRRDLPRGAEEPRRVLCHLQRRSGARAADARRRGRLAGPEGRRTLPLEQLYIGYARHDGR